MRQSKALPLLLFPLFLGCTHRGDRTRPLQTAATVSLQLVAPPSEQYPGVGLFVEAVEVKTDLGWQLLATPKRLVDLGQLSETLLVKDQRLAKGDHRQWRLRLDPTRNTVTLADGTQASLLLAAPLKEGLQAELESTLHRRTDRHDFVLTLDLDTAIVRSQQASGAWAYTFWPTLRAVDKASTGSLTGKLLDEHQAPLAGVVVTAQERQDQGPVVARKALTGPDGTYHLDLLSFARTYHVVAMPRSAGRLFAAQASEAVVLTRALPTHTCDFTFQAKEEGQPLVCRFPPPSKPAHLALVELTQELPAGRFLVQTALVGPAEEGKPGLCEVEHLPLGDYQVRSLHLHFSSEGAPAPVAPAAPKPCEVKGDAKTQVEL